MGKKRSSIPSQARMLFAFAIFRWESAVTLSLSLLLVAFFPNLFQRVWPLWRWWYWLVLGLGAEAILVLTTFSDPSSKLHIFKDWLRRVYPPNTVEDEIWRQAVLKAIQYREQVAAMRWHASDPKTRRYLVAMDSSMSDWLDAFFPLACALDTRVDEHLSQKDESELEAALEEMHDIYVYIQLVGAERGHSRHARQLQDRIAAQVQVLRTQRQAITG